MKINGRSNQSQHISQRKKSLNQQTKLRILMSEVELHGEENRSKKETDEKKIFKFNLEVNGTKGYKLKSLTRLSYTSSLSN